MTDANQNPPSEREWTSAEMEEFFGATGAVVSNAALQSGQFPHPLTIQRLAEMADAFKKEFPVLPPYYRVNQKTYDSLKKLSIPSIGPLLSLSSMEFRIDDTVPDGEAWPPGKLGRDIDDRTQS